MTKMHEIKRLVTFKTKQQELSKMKLRQRTGLKNKWNVSELRNNSQGLNRA